MAVGVTAHSIRRRLTLKASISSAKDDYSKIEERKESKASPLLLYYSVRAWPLRTFKAVRSSSFYRASYLSEVFISRNRLRVIISSLVYSDHVVTEGEDQ